MSNNNSTLASAEPLNDGADWRASLTRNGFKISFFPRLVHFDPAKAG